MAFSVDMSLKALLEDPRAKKVLEKHFGDRAKDPRIDQVMHESLRSISYYPEAGITKTELENVDAELKSL